MDYELYHDESLEGGYWHGILLVPQGNKNDFCDLLVLARNNVPYEYKLGIKNVECRGRIYDCASAWTQLGVAYLRSTPKGQTEHAFLGKRYRGRRQYDEVGLYGMKFILFREPHWKEDFEKFPDHGAGVETTFRFGLKGGLHYLGSAGTPINVTRIHFDGYEHYRRHIDRERIVGKIRGLREYCAIADLADTIDDRHSDHKKAGSQDYEDCQFLQLVDMLIGCFRTSLGYGTRSIHYELARPTTALVKRYLQGYARMRNSRWYRSFVMSECFLQNGRWEFQTVHRADRKEKQPAML